MKFETAPPPDSFRPELADYLVGRKEMIISEWLERVREDPAILPTKRLNTKALKNHLPELIDDLIGTLISPGAEGSAKQNAVDAREHGSTRLDQGYDLTEMLREIKHLRTILICHLRVFEDLNPRFGRPADFSVAAVLHGFLDEMMIDATSEFLWARMSLEDRIHCGYIVR